MCIFRINKLYVFLSTDGVPLSLAYYVQYDTIFESTKQTNMKDSKETKFARTCAEKQMAQGINIV